MSQRRPAGEVTIRSNVVLEPNRWDLVPGELLYELRRMQDATRLQHAEHMYYQPCSVCRRKIVEINLEGCNECPYGPSPREVERAKKAHQLRVEEAVSRELGENSRAEETPTKVEPGREPQPPSR